MKINLSIIMTALALFSSNSFASTSLYNEAEAEADSILQIITRQDNGISIEMLRSFCTQYKEPVEGIDEMLRQNYYNIIKKNIPIFLTEVARQPSPESFIDAIHKTGTYIREQALKTIHSNSWEIFLNPQHISNPDTLMQQRFINAILAFSYTLSSIDLPSLLVNPDEING